MFGKSEEKVKVGVVGVGVLGKYHTKIYRDLPNAELIGVYYINKGYPDFRQITIKYQNEEYAIVEPNSIYGLQEYDYIVLFANSIKMNDYY